MTTDARKERLNLANRKYYNKRMDRWNKLLEPFPCSCCGNPDPSVIQWHHVEPETKDFGIFHTSRVAEDTWWNEVLKCIPVCANCHVKIHKKELCLLTSPIASKRQAATENTSVRDCTCRQ